MVTTYSQNDTLRGKEVWGLPICLALVFTGFYFGVFRHFNNHTPNPHNPSPEIRAVQSQDSSLRNPRDLARLVDKYRRVR
ncbi:MAG: hypothetical protein Q8N63_06955 [Nanoarchaeota archaeon]|nr:hypothetical protein [Nanoarchaeota archaeon]